MFIRLLAITTALLLAFPSTALPHGESDRKVAARQNRTTGSDISNINIQVPLSNGSMSLPSASGKLKAITLAIGTQNYTCKDHPPAPALIGAKAVLFDLNPFLTFLPSDLLSRMPGKALDLPLPQIASVISQVGTHIFNEAGTPCFHLGEVGDMQAQKVEGGRVLAPKDSSDGKGGVDWLKLGDKGGSWGLSEVYRVNTAGGEPPASCEGQGDVVTSPYAALYWFYQG